MITFPTEILTTILPFCSLETILNFASTCKALQKIEKTKLLFNKFKDLIHGNEENSRNSNFHLFTKIVESFSPPVERIPGMITFRDEHNNNNQNRTITKCLIYFITTKGVVEKMVIGPFSSFAKRQCKNSFEIKDSELVLKRFSIGVDLNENDMKNLSEGKIIKQVDLSSIEDLQNFSFVITATKLAEWLNKDTLYQITYADK